jgi:hypothetical protein
MRRWLRRVLRSDIVGRCFGAALTVGTILTAAIYSDGLVDEANTPTVFVKIFLSFFIPYCVSIYASVAAVTNDHSMIVSQR